LLHESLLQLHLVLLLSTGWHHTWTGAAQHQPCALWLQSGTSGSGLTLCAVYAMQCMIFSHIDRTNLAFAALTMNRDLGFNTAV
jgi:hypothetical protein